MTLPKQRTSSAHPSRSEVEMAIAPSVANLLRPHARGLGLVLALQVLSACAGLAPLLAVVELGRLVLSPDDLDKTRAWVTVLLGAVGMLLRLALGAAAAGYAHVLDGRVAFTLRRRLAAQLGRAPLGWLSQRRTGELGKVVGDDVSAIHPLIAHTPGELVTAFLVPVVSLGYLLTIDWRLTLVTLIPVLAALAFVPLMMTPTRTLQQRDFDSAMGHISNAAVEFVQGIAVVKTFGETGRAHGSFVIAVNDFVDTFTRWIRGIAGIAAAMQLAISPPVVMLTVLAAGTRFVSDGSMAPSDVLPFLLLGVGLTAPVAALGHGFDDMQAANRAVARVREVLAVPPLPSPVEPQRPQGHRVELRGVRFAYDPAGPEVLRGVDLALEPGTTTALVGPSGSGKSTLVQLLPRFFDPTSGSVTLGGIDLRDLSAADLHAAVSFVFQDVRLLRTSVADNIALAVPHADLQHVQAAAQLANIHERIMAMPRGYATVVGEETSLSGGEAQRIALARALLSNAPVLVLDEATAFADPQTELAIRETMTSTRGTQAKLIVAHRLETIMQADTVVVLDGGLVVEQGSPDALLRHGGLFATLWNTQQRRAAPPSSATGSLAQRPVGVVR